MHHLNRYIAELNLLYRDSTNLIKFKWKQDFHRELKM